MSFQPCTSTTNTWASNLALTLEYSSEDWFKIRNVLFPYRHPITYVYNSENISQEETFLFIQTAAYSSLGARCHHLALVWINVRKIKT